MYVCMHVPPLHWHYHSHHELNTSINSASTTHYCRFLRLHSIDRFEWLFIMRLYSMFAIWNALLMLVYALRYGVGYVIDSIDLIGIVKRYYIIVFYYVSNEMISGWLLCWCLPLTVCCLQASSATQCDQWWPQRQMRYGIHAYTHAYIHTCKYI